MTFTSDRDTRNVTVGRPFLVIAGAYDCNMDNDFLRNLANSPAMKSIADASAAASRLEQQQRDMAADMERTTAMIGERQRQKAERERTTAESTEALAVYAAEQHEENRRLRYLTNLLAFAVIYDVVNGTFDDHKWWTTLISLAAGAAGLIGALLLGKWRTKKAAAAAEF